MTVRGDIHTKALAGLRFERLRRKLLALHLDLRRVDLNQRRKSRFNDEEAWEGMAIDPAGTARTLFSWQTVTDLLRKGPLSYEVDVRGVGSPKHIEIYREDS